MTGQHLQSGPFSLEAEPPQLSRGTERVALRPKSLAVLRYLAVENLDEALSSLSRVADQDSAGVDISAATITFNMFSAPVLEQSEFVQLRRRLGFAG